MIIDDTIVTGMRVRWDADTTLDALIPVARVYADRIAEKTDWPAAAIKITEGPIMRCGSVHYLRSFEATIVVEHPADSATEPETIRSALSGAFGGDAADSTAGLTISGGTVLHCLEADGGGSKPVGFRKDAADFLRLVSVFQILVKGEE